jgi:hypothetical protein
MMHIAILLSVADFEVAGSALFDVAPRDLYGDGHSAEQIIHILGGQ